MKAKEGVLERLNAILANELVAIPQYFLNAEMCDNWGFERLYQRFRELSFDEMRDTEKLIKHIIYLEGRPSMQTGPIRVAGTVQEQLEAGLELELNAVRTLTEAINHCAQVGDFTTRNILEEMVREEEEHVNWFETQLEAIRHVGLQNYLAQQLRQEE